MQLPPPNLSHITCPVQCGCGDILLTTEGLNAHFRVTRHPFYETINGDYT